MALNQIGRIFTSSLLASSLLFIGCKNVEKQAAIESPGVSSRAPASEQEDEAKSMEKSFQAMLDDQGSPVLRTTYLERLLRIQERTEEYVNEFEQSLDDLIVKQNADPSFEPEPLTTDSYQKLTRMWLISHRMKDQLEFVYRRLLETTKDMGLAGDRRVRAQAILDDTHKWLDERPEADRLQLIEIYQNLAEIKKSTDQASTSSKKGNRQTASVAWDFAYLPSKQLEAKWHKHKTEINKKAHASLAWHDAEVDAALSDVAGNREPSAAATVKPGVILPPSAEVPAMSNPLEKLASAQTAGKVIYPSPGPAGNFYGRQLNNGTFSFTFDDGPAAHSTQRLHGILKAHSDAVNKKGAPATFFCLVNNTLKNPQVIQATKAAGYHMNNHSWTHPNFAKLNPTQLHREVVESTPVLQKAFGYKFRFFRCPYGACFAPKIPLVRQMIADQGLIHAYWAIDSLDWKNIGQPQRTADLAIKQMQLVKKGAILIHDIHESSVDATQIILKWIKAQNSGGSKIRLVDLETAVDEVNGVN